MIDNMYYDLASCDLGDYEVMLKIVPYKILMMVNVSLIKMNNEWSQPGS